MPTKVNKSLQEAKGYVAAGLKLGTVLIPIGAAFRLGLPELTAHEVVAIASSVLGLGMGLYWLTQK